jgi:DNA (cytosine-5)-methyltransferase 1
MAHPDQGGRGRRQCDGDGERDGQAGGRVEGDGVAAGCGEDRLDVADANVSAVRGRRGELPEKEGAKAGRSDNGSGCAGSFWSDAVWLTGSDGKSRRSKPGLPLLVNGISGGISLVRARKDGAEETHTYNRVGALRAFGNAICAPLAAEVIKAFMETES